MRFKKFSERKWYNGAVVACIGVAFYVLLTNLGSVTSYLRWFLGSFKSIFLGVVFAYIINPLAKLFYYRMFKRMKVGQKRWALSVMLAFLTGLAVLLVLIGMLIPQLAQSIVTFSSNYESYAKTLINMLQESRLGKIIGVEKFDTLTQNALSSIQSFVLENAGAIISGVANSGKRILSTVISLIVALYLLLTKKTVLQGVRRLIRALLRPAAFDSLMDFLLRCDTIFMSFIGQSILDSLIVGCVNAVLMLVFRMQYVGLVSVVVAVTNLVPNFGPVIGGVIGCFILVLVNPWHAVVFLIITMLLQTLDAYVIKPKLFGNSLGVSGLLILVSSIVFGNLFGILGVLLSIPAATILSFVYHEYLLPRQEERMRKIVEEEKRSAGK